MEAQTRVNQFTESRAERFHVKQLGPGMRRTGSSFAGAEVSPEVSAVQRHDPESNPQSYPQRYPPLCPPTPQAFLRRCSSWTQGKPRPRGAVTPVELRTSFGCSSRELGDRPSAPDIRSSYRPTPRRPSNTTPYSGGQVELPMTSQTRCHLERTDRLRAGEQRDAARAPCRDDSRPGEPAASDTHQVGPQPASLLPEDAGRRQLSWEGK